jgi:hypothetical protein
MEQVLIFIFFLLGIILGAGGVWLFLSRKAVFE